MIDYLTYLIPNALQLAILRYLRRYHLRLALSPLAVIIMVDFFPQIPDDV
jgi:hypothetical protein